MLTREYLIFAHRPDGRTVTGSVPGLASAIWWVFWLAATGWDVGYTVVEG
jgi:hypothetical protein